MDESVSLFDSLDHLFRIQIVLSKRHFKKINLDRNCRIPISQHNLFKLLPFHIFQIQPGKFRVCVTEKWKLFVEDLNLPDGVVDLDEDGVKLVSSEERESFGWKTIEDRDQKEFFEFFVNEIEDFGLEDVGFQLNLSYLFSFNFENWYSAVKDIKITDENGEVSDVVDQTFFVPLKNEEIQKIYDLHILSDRGKYIGTAFSEIMLLKKSLEGRIQGAVEKVLGATKESNPNEDEKKHPETPFFFKFNIRSAKDSSYYKESGVLAAIKKDDNALKKCQARNTFDLLSAVIASKRIAEDCKSYLSWRTRNTSKSPMQILVQKFRDIDPRHEFRCWIYNGKLTAVTPLMYMNYNECYESENLRKEILRAAQILIQTIHNLIPWKSYILDIIYVPEAKVAKICEFNPWGPYSSTESLLYSWELDRDLLFGLRTDINYPDFRFLRKGMSVESSFWLLFSESHFVPSPRFLEMLSKCTKDCHCCPRLNDGFPNVRKFMHISTDEGKEEYVSRLSQSELISLSFIIRSDLNMTPSNAIVQCSRAAVNAVLKLSRGLPSSTSSSPTRTRNQMLNQWIRQGQSTSTFQADSLEQMMEIRINAEQIGIPTLVVHDEKINGKSGDRTVVVLGPAPASKIRHITASLKFY